MSSAELKFAELNFAIAQLSPQVGAFDRNLSQIIEAWEKAAELSVDLLLTPELSICGYPLHDLMDRPEIFDRCEKSLQILIEKSKSLKTDLLVGHVRRNPSSVGRSAQNTVSLISAGKEIHSQAKTLLPTYDVFDESRYFEPASQNLPFTWRGKRVGLAVCEDLWAKDSSWGRHLYGKDPTANWGSLDYVFSLSASPYVRGKRDKRLEIHSEVACRTNATLIYVNQTGATDEILFDGASFAMDSSGKVYFSAPTFQNGFYPVLQSQQVLKDLSDDQVLLEALVTGIREYFHRTGFKKTVLGLSGGIDSAVVASLAVLALGRENVTGIAMPSPFSSGHSLSDAEALAVSLGIAFEVHPIKFVYTSWSRELGQSRGGLKEIALENLQSRLRGNLLMTLSNHDGSLVLTTGNKSEIACGYCTLYGDMCGALAPIGDLYKTEVYDLAQTINRIHGGWIPQNTITKAPSAELRPGQVDQDSLPPYPVLDPVLRDYLEECVPLAELKARHEKKMLEKGWIEAVLRKVELSEFKRRQGAPILKVSGKSFGIGRRFPISKGLL